MSLENIERRDRERDMARLTLRLQEEFPQDVPGALMAAWEMGAAYVANLSVGRVACRICGCWELEACEGGCAWAEADLCTACVEPWQWRPRPLPTTSPPSRSPT